MIKCTFCGRFISYNDLHAGAATHEMVSPDSELTNETYETECIKCKEKELEKAVRWEAIEID